MYLRLVVERRNGHVQANGDLDDRVEADRLAVCAASVASPENNPSRFTLQQSPHDFFVELFDTATPRHADLLPKPSSERTDDEHD